MRPARAAADYRVKHLVIGAGVVGLACATRLSRHGPTLVVDRHKQFGEETSSRNSEVIHAGIYYPPFSLKTKYVNAPLCTCLTARRLCIKGNRLLYKFAERARVPHRRLGKWLLAQNDEEHAHLEGIKRKCEALSVPLHWLSRREIEEGEPNVQTRDVLYSPSTGIIDSHSLMAALEALLLSRDGLAVYSTEVSAIERAKEGGGYLVSTGPEPCVIQADTVINSAGLAASVVARMIVPELPPSYVTYFCKGHYFGYNGPSLVHCLVYPVPEKNLAGLGVHATLDMGGRMRFGPDTLYINNPSDYHIESGTQLDKIYDAVRKYLPGVRREMLYPDYAGIRPKLSREGEAARDFVIENEEARGLPGFVNLLGIESPGLTSCLAIAALVAEKLGYASNVGEEDEGLP